MGSLPLPAIIAIQEVCIVKKEDQREVCMGRRQGRRLHATRTPPRRSTHRSGRQRLEEYPLVVHLPLGADTHSELNYKRGWREVEGEPPRPGAAEVVRVVLCLRLCAHERSNRPETAAALVYVFLNAELLPTWRTFDRRRRCLRTPLCASLLYKCNCKLETSPLASPPPFHGTVQRGLPTRSKLTVGGGRRHGIQRQARPYNTAASARSYRELAKIKHRGFAIHREDSASNEGLGQEGSPAAEEKVDRGSNNKGRRRKKRQRSAPLLVLLHAVLAQVGDPGCLSLLGNDLASDGIGAQGATEQQDVWLRPARNEALKTGARQPRQTTSKRRGGAVP